MTNQRETSEYKYYDRKSLNIYQLGWSTFFGEVFLFFIYLSVLLNQRMGMSYIYLILFHLNGNSQMIWSSNFLFRKPIISWIRARAFLFIIKSTAQFFHQFDVLGIMQTLYEKKRQFQTISVRTIHREEISISLPTKD